MRRLTLLLAGLVLLLSACSPRPAPVKVTVYFTNLSRFEVGTEPYEDPVTRSVTPKGSLPETVLSELFLGPTPQEKAQGLELFSSGTTGYKRFSVVDGVARVYLTGTCNSKGSTYTIANLIGANLAQFPEIKAIKIYDENGKTESPEGQSGSIPICLEP